MEQIKNKKITTQQIARIGIFSALAAILYIVPIFQFKIPSVFPSFLEFHFDEIPVFIASFAYGPMVGFWVLVIRTIIKLPFTSTVCVGELADFIYSVAFILPAATIYKRNRSLKGVCIGFLIGFFFQVLVSGLLTCFVMIDFYLYLYKGLTADTLLKSMQAINPHISDIHLSLTIWGIVPFNILKDAIVILITFIIYKKISPLLKKV